MRPKFVLLWFNCAYAHVGHKLYAKKPKNPENDVPDDWDWMIMDYDAWLRNLKEFVSEALEEMEP